MATELLTSQSKQELATLNGRRPDNVRVYTERSRRFPKLRWRIGEILHRLGFPGIIHPGIYESCTGLRLKVHTNGGNHLHIEVAGTDFSFERCSGRPMGTAGSIFK